jgi:hypothetical protein
VSAWLRRWPDLPAEALVADWGRVKILWWPTVLRWLARHGIPAGTAAAAPGSTSDEAMRDLIRAWAPYLVTPAGIARRAKVAPPTVSNWFRRWPDLGDTAVIADLGAAKILWWPSVRTWLGRHHVPFTDDDLEVGP